jgi:hypothetical protein
VAIYQVTRRYNSEIKYRNFHSPDNRQLIQFLCDVLCQGKVVPDYSKDNAPFLQSEAVQKNELLEIKLKAQQSFETSATANPATDSRKTEELNNKLQVLNKLERSSAGCLVVHFNLLEPELLF